MGAERDQGMTEHYSFDPDRKRPYKTGELAALFGVSRNTIIRWIKAGRFGLEGAGWRWTEGGPSRGDREVFAAAVKKYLDIIA